MGCAKNVVHAQLNPPQCGRPFAKFIAKGDKVGMNNLKGLCHIILGV